MYVVTVEFVVKIEHMQDFRMAIVANARTSRELEPGCHQFDVCTNPANSRAIFLYELYSDRAAFDAHLASDHFRRFDQQVAAWVEHKTARMLERLDPSVRSP
ncbi:MAG: putative quinol monooxygenase [Betaproteobacteria bacterium]